MDAAALKTKSVARPTASANIEPIGSRADQPRAHAVRLHVELNGFEEKFADRGLVSSFVQTALAELSDQKDTKCVAVLGAKEKVVAIEAAIVCANRPDSDAVGRLREALSSAGYGVFVREVRECEHESCTATAAMETSRPDAAPAGWYSSQICGKHGYRSCGSCGSVYMMISENASGSAPSVHCEVCGTIIVEWGGTKLWTAELVTRGGAA